MFSSAEARDGGKPRELLYLCICVFVFVHKYDDSMGLPPCLAPAEENVERLAAFYYRLNVTYFKIPQSDGISPRLNLHLPLKKLFLNWMLLEKNNEEVKKPEQKCLVLFFHNKNKKEQNI